MRLLTSLWVVLLAFLISSCTPNQSIALDNRNPEAGNANESATGPSEPARKITVADLMSRVANANPDAFLFPCTLNAYSDDDRTKLRKLRQTWLSKEQDSRYSISPATDCVCPSICVLAVEDNQKKQPANSAIIVLGETSPESYLWLIRDLDLTHGSIAWSGATPQIIFHDLDGTIKKTCSIERDKASTRYSTGCVSPRGEKAPSL